MKISIGTFLVAFTVLLLVPVKESHSGRVVIGTPEGRRAFDLVDPIERDEFVTMFGDDPKVSGCIQKAGYAITMMEDRDAGITQQEQLENVRANYEETKLEPQGGVPWHVYIDFERMVRDVYRSAGASTESGYRNTDPNIVWDREFQWCAIRR